MQHACIVHRRWLWRALLTDHACACAWYRRPLQVLAAAASQAVREHVAAGLSSPQLGLAPPIPDAWSSTATTSATSTQGAKAQVVLGEVLSTKRRVSIQEGDFPYAPAGYPDAIVENVFQFEGGQTVEINGACLELAHSSAIPFSSLFAWLPAAHDGGVVTHHGEPAHRWVYTVAGVFGAEVLFGTNNLPVAMTENFTDPSTKRPASVTYEFANFTASALPGWDRTWSAMTRACAKPPRCEKPPAASQPQNVTMFIFHPPNNFEIAGQDLGDPLGDTLFVCQDILGGKPNATDHDYQWLSKWTVELLPWWGQYQNCNGQPSIPCPGPATRLT